MDKRTSKYLSWGAVTVPSSHSLASNSSGRVAGLRPPPPPTGGRNETTMAKSRAGKETAADSAQRAKMRPTSTVQRANGMPSRLYVAASVVALAAALAFSSIRVAPESTGGAVTVGGSRTEHQRAGTKKETEGELDEESEASYRKVKNAPFLVESLTAGLCTAIPEMQEQPPPMRAVGGNGRMQEEPWVHGNKLCGALPHL